MPYKRAVYKGPPYRFLVRYDHETHSVFVDCRCGPALEEGTSVYGRVRRLSDSYQFSTWESPRGDLLTAQFSFSEGFFSLPVPPRTLSQDLRTIAYLSGMKEVVHADVWWIATISHSLFQCPIDGADQPEDGSDAE